ncbi:hypothetical protein D3C78_958420 [compost metagenome]
MLLAPYLHDLGQAPAGALDQFGLRCSVKDTAAGDVLERLSHQHLGIVLLVVAPQAETHGQRHRQFAVEEEGASSHRLDFLSSGNVLEPV